MNKKIPAPIIAILAKYYPGFLGHSALDNLFYFANAPGDPPSGSKQLKVQTWLRLINQNSEYPCKVLGKLIQEYMDMSDYDEDEGRFSIFNETYRPSKLTEFKDEINTTLKQFELSYKTGGLIVEDLSQMNGKITDREELLINSSLKVGQMSKKENLISSNQIDIFISHSSQDKVITSKLIDLIRSALNLPANKIRATSVEGFRLPIGSKADQELRREAIQSEVFIALITPHSISSIFVLFELGARWGIGKPILPLLAKGMEPNKLNGPIHFDSAIKCNNTSDLNHFIEQLSQSLKTNLENIAAYQKNIKEVAEESENITIEDLLLLNSWRLIYNSEKKESKSIRFKENGFIEGVEKNSNEHHWQIDKNQNLELLNLSDDVFSRFYFDQNDFCFKQTNKKDTLVEVQFGRCDQKIIIDK